MQFSLLTLTLLISVGLVAAAPAPGGNKSKSPPGPPSGKFSKVKQQCSAKQSSIRCCNVSSSKGNKKVSYKDESFDLVCNQISGTSSDLLPAVVGGLLFCCRV